MYRTETPMPKEPTRHAIDRSSKTNIWINNGITSRIAFPCFYIYHENGDPFTGELPPMLQDHLGWPSPENPDRSFQPTKINGLIIDPIHLADEGYDEAIITLKTPPEGLSASAVIDDNVVRVTLNAMCPEADVSEIHVPFALYVSGTFIVGETEYPTRDIVTNGVIRIIPTIHETISE